MIRLAKFDPSRAYRYWLLRAWDDSKPTVMCIGLNPSTADEERDDPTIRRLISLFDRAGFGSFYMTNLFALVTPYPAELFKSVNPIGENDSHLRDIRKRCEKVVFAWGNFKVNGRDKEVTEMFPDSCCFGLNKNGTPKHPLYLPACTAIVPFDTLTQLCNG